MTFRIKFVSRQFLTWRIFCFDLHGRNQIRLSFHLLMSIWQMFRSGYEWIFTNQNPNQVLYRSLSSFTFRFEIWISFVFLWSRGVVNRLQYRLTEAVGQLGPVQRVLNSTFWPVTFSWPAAGKYSALTCMALSSLDFKNGISNYQITPNESH